MLKSVQSRCQLWPSCMVCVTGHVFILYSMVAIKKKVFLGVSVFGSFRSVLLRVASFDHHYSWVAQLIRPFLHELNRVLFITFYNRRLIQRRTNEERAWIRNGWEEWEGENCERKTFVGCCYTNPWQTFPIILVKCIYCSYQKRSTRCGTTLLPVVKSYL